MYCHIEGVKEIRSSVIKNIFHNPFGEVKCFDNASDLSIESMVLQSVYEMIHNNLLQPPATLPGYLRQRDLLYDRYNENISLQEIALEINMIF
ncbi:MAG: hypothetical protein ABI863_23665 [Ginsengibacter sp.]